MPTVRITKSLAINLRGYDREATELAPGEHEVPESVGAWLRANPEWGEVLGEGEAGSAAAAAGERAAGLEGTVDEIAEYVPGLDDVATLEGLLVSEEAGKNRKGVREAIAARIAELEE